MGRNGRQSCTFVVTRSTMPTNHMADTGLRVFFAPMVGGREIMAKSKLVACTLALLTFTVGCSTILAAREPQDEIYFLRDKQPSGSGGDAALLEGILKVSDGCLLIADDYGVSFSPVWPYEYSYKQVGDNVEIFSSSGEVGERVGASGGEFAPRGYAELEKYVSGNLNCPKPFWNVVGVQ